MADHPASAGAAPKTQFGLTIAVTVVGSVLGFNATTVGRWLAHLHAWWFVQSIQPLYVAQTAVTVLAVGFLVIVAVGAHSAARSGQGATAVVGGALGAIAGSIFSVVKEMPGSKDAPGADSLQPLYFVLVAALLFGLPLLRPPGVGREQSLASLYGRIAVAAIAGGVLSGLVQMSPNLLPSRWFAESPEGILHPSHSSFFIVRPIATGMLISAWAIAAFDPQLERELWRPSRWGGIWTGGFVALAVALCAIYALAFNYPDHREWIDRTGLSRPLYLLMFLLLMIPPLFATGYVFAFRQPGRIWGRTVAAMSAFLAVGPIAVAAILSFTAGMPAANATYLALAQFATAWLVVVAATGAQARSAWFAAPLLRSGSAAG